VVVEVVKSRPTRLKFLIKVLIAWWVHLEIPPAVR